MKTIQKDTFEIVKSAVNKAVDIIAPTYGPASNKVIIARQFSKMAVDDGVQIARDLEFEDEAENAVLFLVKQTAISTNDRVGDGTTSSLIMLRSIINAVASRVKFDGREVEKELKRGLADAKKQLLAEARAIKSKEDLRKVARISFDNEEIASLIADTWFSVGKDGVVTVDRSGTMDTSVEMTDGVTLNTGFCSPYMVSNPSRMEAVVEKPYILLTDYRLTNVNDILPVMNLLASKNIHSLVVIAENVEQEALATINVNILQQKFRVVAVPAPKENRTQFLDDLGLLTGAKVFSAEKGDKVELATMDDLGRADRFIAKQSSSVVLGAKGVKQDVKKAIEDLKLAIENEKNPKEKEAHKQRLARLTNKVAVIKVGAATEQEQTTLKYKVEDAVNAVKSAFISGVVCGSGLALARLVTSSRILNEALKQPHEQLKRNMGIYENIVLRDTDAYNVVTGEKGNYFSVGVVDPVEVLLAGVESAVSIASVLLTTSAIMYEPKEKEKTG